MKAKLLLYAGGKEFDLMSGEVDADAKGVLRSLARPLEEERPRGRRLGGWAAGRSRETPNAERPIGPIDQTTRQPDIAPVAQ